ncbi:carbohydrate-binding family 9-like protein [Desertivirga arenae]|uniref:carbohydrate-binding family 9-like protein n=1 Tax=Desertivirga arenae TaxID=2810309 RepID=UPI001A961DBF|nr:carbohydrate-binding family 9-like protein [Pedobacter sp. SYSU D00823]
MKKINISLLPEHLITLKETSNYLDTLEKNEIKEVSWQEYPYSPNTSFSVAYTKNAIALKYYVQEKAIKALNIYSNQPVYEDSCVEFFIAFNDELEYYNIEFNCTGTCCAGFGKEKNSRKKISDRNIEKIRHETWIRSKGILEGDIYWELTVLIPLSVFQFHTLGNLLNSKCKVNFYKCGDHLPEPHFLSWTRINNPTPNFHMPEYFGLAHFN